MASRKKPKKRVEPRFEDAPKKKRASGLSATDDDRAAPPRRKKTTAKRKSSGARKTKKTARSRLGLTGLIVTKLDGTSRGGAIVGIYRELKLPIHFVGLGEKPDDLQPFSVSNYANAIFGLEGAEAK